MSRQAASSAAAAAAADGSLKPTTYRPPTIAGMSTALLPARDSLGSMLATAPAAARKQARAEAEERKEEEKAAAHGENGNKRMRMTLSEEAAQQRAAAAAAAGGGSGSPALSSSRVPPPMQLSRSFSVPGAAGGPLADAAAAAAAAGDHGMGFDLNASADDDDFFDSIDPGSARNSLWNAQGLANLRANVATTPVPAPASAASSSSAAAAAAAADDASYAQLTFPDPPLDWNLHSRIRFTSASSFDWVSGSSSPAAATEHALEGVQTFMSLGRADACNCRTVSPLRELHHALSYSTFPASPFGKMHPLTSVLRTALNKPREQRGQMDQLQLTHLQRLWIQWEDAFRSLYYRTRLPPSSPAWLDHFYSINRGGPGSGGGLLTYSVLFLAADPDESEEGGDIEGAPAPGSLEKAPAALISRSNRGLRAMLTAKGVGFTMPNDPRSRAEKTANQSGSLDAMVDGPEPLSRQLSSQQRQRINQAIADEDLTCASVLLVQGRKDVHALYDTLLTQDRTSRELDLPALFASAPFLNAVTRQVNIIKVGQAKAAGGGAEDKITKNAGAAAGASSSAGLDDVYTLDLAGPLLPSSVTRLLPLFQSTQLNGSFIAHFAPSDFPPSYFNCVGTDRVLSLDGLRADACLGIGGQESLAQSTPAHLSGKARLRIMGSLRRVKANKEHFLVQLNTQQHA